MKLVGTTFLIGAFLFCSNLLNAQEKISKKDKIKIQETCELYLRNHGAVVTDPEAPTDSLLNIVSDPIFTIALAYRDFYKKMAYDNLVFTADNVLELELTDSIGCIVDTDPSYKINLKKVEKDWIVVGYDNYVLNQDDVDRANVRIQARFDQEIVKDSIQDILLDFVEGWSEMRQFQKSNQLKSVTSSEFYEYIMAQAEYDSLRGYRKGPVSIKEMDRVSISQDTARCRLYIKGEGGSQFSLLKRNGTWLVAGADGRICKTQDAIDVKNRIQTYHELIKFSDRIDVFNDRIEIFLKTGDRSYFRDVATDQFIDRLEIYRRLAGTFDTSYLKVYGMSGPLFPEHDFVIYGDSAYFDTYSDSIRWIKQDGNWLIDALFSSIEIENDCNKAHQTFREFYDQINISYSWRNTIDFDDGREYVDFPEETDYTKMKHYHRLDDYYDEITYEDGNQDLFDDLYTLTKKASRKTTFRGRIYVEFDIDNLGKANNIRVLDQVGTEQASLAEGIVNQLGNWLPNDNQQSSTTNMVVAIQF